MRLLLIRHGQADSAPVDAERQLSFEGRRRLAAEARGLARLGVRFGRVLTSPLVRAVQTAELLEPLLAGPDGAGREVADELAREPSEALLERCRGDNLALIGHEPWQGQLASWLVTGDPHGACFALEPGGVLVLDGLPQPGRMVLRGFWRCEDLAAIGELGERG
jgi:phosphohistidine phosphatase